MQHFSHRLYRFQSAGTLQLCAGGIMQFDDQNVHPVLLILSDTRGNPLFSMALI
uniref:Uncharacterized protein n=1 Tax=Anguilla anguilla TaxID=7936 RepID=A0A0E9SS41_ANGAN